MRPAPCFLCRIFYGHGGHGCIESDYLAQLCALVKECGGQMTFYGQPISGPEELRARVLDHAIGRIAGAIAGAS